MEAALERLARDRLHHRLDDPVPRRRVHARAVHGRRGRPAAPRVRGDHRRRRPRLRLRLPHAHAHGVQPLPAPRGTERHGRLYAASERVFDGMLAPVRPDAHGRPCATARLTLAVFVLTLVATALSVHDHPQGLHPERGHRADLRLHRGAAGHLVRQHGRSTSGRWRPSSGSSPTSTTSCRRSARAGPTSCPTPGASSCASSRERSRPSADEIIQDLRKKLSGIPGINVYPQILPTIRIGGQLTKGLYQYTLQDADLGELYRWAPVLFDKLRALPGFLDVNTDLQITSPQVLVEIDRDKAVGARRHGGADRERAQQRLRLAPGLDDLHADQSVLGDDGAPARVPAGSRRPRHALRPRLERASSSRSTRWPSSRARWARSPSTTWASSPR